MRERTEWHRVVLFGRLGEIAGEYLRRGSKVYIEGRIQTRKWQGRDGQERWATDIDANEMQMLDRRGASGGASSDARSDYGGGQAPAGDASTAPFGATGHTREL